MFTKILKHAVFNVENIHFIAYEYTIYFLSYITQIENKYTSNFVSHKATMICFASNSRKSKVNMSVINYISLVHNANARVYALIQKKKKKKSIASFWAL